MNCLKRAYLYVTRKKGKSILLFLILLVTATFVLSGLCIGDATRQAQMNLRKNLGGAFDMAVNYSEDNPYYRQEESENDDGTKRCSHVFNEAGITRNGSKYSEYNRRKIL